MQSVNDKAIHPWTPEGADVGRRMRQWLADRARRRKLVTCLTAGVLAFVLGLAVWPRTTGGSPAPAAPTGDRPAPALDLPGPSINPEDTVEKSFKIAVALAISGGDRVMVKSHKSSRKRDPLSPSKWIYEDHPDTETVLVSRELWERARTEAGGKIKAGDLVKARGKLKVRLGAEGDFQKPSLAAETFEVVK